SLDQCNGTSDFCQHPAGNAGTTCRGVAGACDVAESCTGTSTLCPPTAFEPAATVCRPSVGECDLDDHCPGNGPACPADAKQAAGTSCSPDANPASRAECEGVTADCQHPAGNAGSTCRAAAGICDVTES